MFICTNTNKKKKNQLLYIFLINKQANRTGKQNAMIKKGETLFTIPIMFRFFNHNNVCDDKN